MNSLAIKCYQGNTNNVLNSGDSILETDFFCVVIETTTKLEPNNFVVLITDYPFELNESITSDKFTYTISENSLYRYFRQEGFDLRDYSKEIDSLKFSKLFLNYPIGISDIQLYNIQDEITLTDFKLNVTSNKLNESDFFNLVEYIESKSVALWSQYSLLKNSTTLIDEIDKNDWQMFFFQIFIKELNEKYLYRFQFDKLQSLQTTENITSYTSDVMVDDNSIFWLTQNLDSLVSTHSRDIDKILIQNRLFVPTEILINLTIESTDIIENRFVHGFLNYLLEYLTQYKNELKKQTSFDNLEKNFQEILYFYSQKRKLGLVKQYLNSLNSIKQVLLESIPVTESVLDFISTSRINSKDHYQYLYQKFVEWFNYDKFKHSNNKLYFKGVTRMDKLFERACLYKIIDFFICQGYKYEIIEKIDSIPTEILFKNEISNRSHTLFFEKIPEKMVTKIRGGILKPDFLIEFDNNKILILDAKYKNNATVQKYDWESLSLKYLHGIGYKNENYFTPIALFALIPAFNNKTEFYHSNKYDINSAMPTFPAIGSLVVDFNEKNQEFYETMKKIINFCK